jgi:hypothetical protein
MIFKNTVFFIFIFITTHVSNGDKNSSNGSDAFVYNLTGMVNPTKIANNTIRPSSVKQFPALENMGISCTLFELAPCGINLPHIHPRASELIYVISADNLQVGFVGKF